MLLKKGNSGLEVTVLQNRLGIKKSGYFGDITERTVKEFQRKNGLVPDGKVGSKTWYTLFPISSTTPAIKDLNQDDIKWDKLLGEVPDEVINSLKNMHDFVAKPNILHVTHFLAQCAHESGGWKKREENLNYDTDGLMSTFSRHFANRKDAQTYARRPKAIANRVYANRLGNGDEASGDGWKHRGVGWIQSTGKENHRRFGNWVGQDAVSDPTIIRDKYPTEASLFFFTDNDIWDICDNGTTLKIIKQVTAKINPALLDLSERTNYFNHYLKVLHQ
jgi:putative chitinase